MTPKAEAQDSRFDVLKWLVVVALVVVGVVGNHYYSGSPILYRVLALLAIAAVAAFVGLQTAKGKSFFVLAKEARAEIRKVVWPTRQETTQTTPPMYMQFGAAHPATPELPAGRLTPPPDSLRRRISC